MDAKNEKGSRRSCGLREGHVEAARLLLEKGAAVDAKNKEGATALMKACQFGQEAARLLLEKGRPHAPTTTATRP